MARDSPTTVFQPTGRSQKGLTGLPGQKWWRQPSINPGMTTTTIYLGEGTTKKGTSFTVIAMTTDKRLPQSTFLSLPECRTKSKEYVLIRG
jgi:hypothetical protein